MAYKLPKKLQGTTPERAKHFTTIIDAVSKDKLSIIEISECIGMTKSGGRKYIRDLREEGIIQEVGYASGKIGNLLLARPLYAVNPDSEYVKRFLDAINAPAKDGLPRRRGQHKEFDASATLHVMNDDEIYRIKRAPVKIPAHTDLMKALFGMNPAC